MPTTKTDDGTTLSYQTWGSGPTTLMIYPGWSFSSMQWEDFCQTADLSGLRVICLDPRGFGKSGKPREGYTLERLRDDLLAVANAEQVKTFVLLGHSMGGKIAQFVTATAPERVLGQLLALPVPASPLPLPQPVIELYRSCPGNRANFWLTLSLAMCEMPSPVLRDKMLNDCLQAGKEALLQTFEQLILQGDCTDAVKKTTVPTVVVGTDDPIMTLDLLKATVMAQVPGAQLVHVPHAGHYPHLVRPQEFAAVVRAFCAGLVPRA